MARKKPRKASPSFCFRDMLAAIIAVSLAECALAGFGFIPPILSYSPANLFFAFLRLAIAVYAGYSFASGGVARAALRGGALFLASALAICLSVLAAKGIATHAILGIFVQDGMLMTLFAIIAAENTIVGAAIAAVVAWLSRQAFFQKLISPKKT